MINNRFKYHWLTWEFSTPSYCSLQQQLKECNTDMLDIQTLSILRLSIAKTQIPTSQLTFGANQTFHQSMIIQRRYTVAEIAMKAMTMKNTMKTIALTLRTSSISLPATLLAAPGNLLTSEDEEANTDGHQGDYHAHEEEETLIVHIYGSALCQTWLQWRLECQTET